MCQGKPRIFWKKLRGMVPLLWLCHHRLIRYSWATLRIPISPVILVLCDLLSYNGQHHFCPLQTPERIVVLGLEQASSPPHFLKILLCDTPQIEGRALPWARQVPTKSPKPGVGPTCDPYMLRVTWFLQPVLNLKHSAVLARGTACVRACALTLPCSCFRNNLPQNEVSILLLCLHRRKLTILISLQALPRPQQEGFPDGMGINSEDNKCLGRLHRIWSLTKGKMNDNKINLQLKKAVPSAPRILSMPCK